MKIKKPIMYMIAIAIVGLLITSASSLAIKQTSNEDEIRAEYLVVNSQPLLKTRYDNSMQPLFYSVPITGGDYDEFHPSVAGSPAGGFYALVEESTDGYVWQPALYGSADGVVWDPILTALYPNSEYTDMDQNVYATYGTFGASPDNSGQIIVLEAEIEDGSVWDFASSNINQLTNNRIACYTHEGPDGDPGTWNWGGLAMSGYNGFGTNDFHGCPYVFYQYSSAGGGIIGWLTGASVAGCEHAANDIDLETNIMYSVWDRDTGTEWELLVRKDNFGIWNWNPSGGYYSHAYMTSIHVSDPANLTYPSIAAHDNNVIVACQKGSDVVVYYSTNGFASRTEVPIETLAYYPEIVFAAKGLAILTYIKDNVLYYRTSNTSGATWSAAQVVSDNQVNLNDRAAHLEEFGGSVYCVWEDTRGTNLDAYFDLIYEYINHPPATPTLDGETDLKKFKNYTYTFSTTDPDGDQVYYLVEWGDGTSTGWITETSATHSWDKGTYLIRCKAKDEFGAESAYAELEVSAPRGRFITLRFLDLFPNAFLLLRLIFGR
jgi:hypothetical protein